MYIFEWDGTDLLNNDVASGVYFYELRGESFISKLDIKKIPQSSDRGIYIKN